MPKKKSMAFGPTEQKKIRRRCLFVGACFILAFGIVAAKAIHVQLYQGPWLYRQAWDQVESSYSSVGRRGTIYDRNQRELAVSLKVPSIIANPRDIENPQSTAKELARVLEMQAPALAKLLKTDRSFVWVKRLATPQQAEAVETLDLKGIAFIPEFSRFYPHKTLAAQTLGFTGIDGNGLEGIEFAYDNRLRGREKEVTGLKDARGKWFDAEKSVAPGASGDDLVLTIDRTIQYIAEGAVETAVTKHKAKSGLAVVMDPNSGAILAMAQYPSFNPNRFQAFGKDLWRNRILTDPYEPGSILKVFTAAAALESGSASANTIFYCENGKYRIGRNTVHDVHGHGWLSLQQIIKYSSNIGAVKIGEKIGRENLYQFLNNFGFGSPTGIDCPGETGGNLSHFRRWSRIDAGAIAFGHGISVSAVQLVSAVSAIANGGVLMKPYLVQAVRDWRGRTVDTFGPTPVRRVISQETARILSQIMGSVTDSGGTGINAAIDGYTVCGKSGTAQKVAKTGGYAKGRYVSSFIGFTPMQRPALAILVTLDEPRNKYYGGTVAAPAFKEIASQSLSYLNIPPDVVAPAAEGPRQVSTDSATSEKEGQLRDEAL